MSNYLEQYADAVLTGKIVACLRLKQQYRILADKLEHPSKYKPYIYDDFLANDHINFIETFCKQAQGKMGAPLKLELFQKAKFQAAFGFVDENTGFRQYGEVLTIEGRKNGKTTETSAISLALLINDGEGSPEIYNVATKRDQAGKGFDETWKMIKQSPALRKHIRKRVADLYCDLNMGSIRALASDNLDGLNSHGVTIDELEAIKNRSVYDDMKQSVSARDQAILFCNSTNGYVREGIFDSQYKYACKVLDGKIKDDAFLAFIYELDDPDNEWVNEEMWIKANPGLGSIKKIKTLRGYVEKAKEDPSFKSTVMVKDFNAIQNSSVAWLKWEELNNEETFDIEFDYGIGGFDAADSTDLNSAKVLCVRPNDPKIYVQSMYWIPQATLDAAAALGKQESPDNAPYEFWVQQNHMRVVPGNKVNKQVILDWFIELMDEGLYIRYIGYDPWHISDDLLAKFQSTFGSKSMIEIRQGAKTLSTPMKDLKADFQGKRIIYNNNPIDKWCLYNTGVRVDINGNIQPVKKLDPRLRIDGAVSLICGYIVLCDNREELETMNEPV